MSAAAVHDVFGSEVEAHPEMTGRYLALLMPFPDQLCVALDSTGKPGNPNKTKQKQSKQQTSWKNEKLLKSV